MCQPKRKGKRKRRGGKEKGEGANPLKIFFFEKGRLAGSSIKKKKASSALLPEKRNRLIAEKSEKGKVFKKKKSGYKRPSAPKIEREKRTRRA